MSNDKRICDRCNNFSISQCNTYERCEAMRDRNNFVNNRITTDYINERFNGNKSHCKAFKKLTP